LFSPFLEDKYIILFIKLLNGTLYILFEILSVFTGTPEYRINIF